MDDDDSPQSIQVTLPSSYQFTLTDADRQRLLDMRKTFYQKENERKLTKLGLPILGERAIQRRDMDWLEIVLPFVKLYNPHCGVCASSKNYGRRLDMQKSYLLRSYFYCQGRDCPFNCILTVKENGKGLICSRTSDGNLVDHRNAKRVTRPNRSFRSTSTPKKAKQREFAVNPVLEQWNQTVTIDEEFSWTSFRQLTEKFRRDIEPNGPLPGAIRHISLDPLSVVVHTAKSLRNLSTTNNGLVQLLTVKSEERKFVHHELLVNRLDDSTFVPISFAFLSPTDETFALKIWFERLRFDHQSSTFPRPFLVLVDEHRDTPLNNVVLQFFNNESFDEYLTRTSLLLSSQSESSTHVLLHRPSASIIGELRQLVLQHVPSELRQLALWSTLLLLHSSTWKETRQIWALICEIFLNWGTNFVSLNSYEDLCSRVSKIENDDEISHLLDFISNSHCSTNDDDDDSDDDDLDEPPADFQNDHSYTKSINDYQAFATDFRRIFNDKNQSKSALISSWETLSNTDRTTLKKIRGNWKWLNALLKDFLPSIVVWSNLIFSLTPNTQLKQLRLNKRLSKLNSSREKRSNQIQRIHLAERLHGKSDVLLGQLVKDFQQQVLNNEL